MQRIVPKRFFFKDINEKKNKKIKTLMKLLGHN